MAESHDTEVLDEAIIRLVARLRKGRYYGIAELHFQEGRIVRIKKQETLLPKDLNRLAAV